MWPLEGTRIVDFTAWAAGAGMSAILADLGAEVIKIESHKRMDASRGWGPWPDGFDGEDPWNHCGSFHQLNRNKLGVTLDLKDGRCRALLERLIAKSHVVTENFRAGVLDRLGLGYERLQELRPGIVLVSLTPFGSTGPEAGYGAMGPTIEMVAGLAAVTRYPGDDLPHLTGVHYTDGTTPLFASGLTIAALRRQRLTGRGAHIEVAQRELQTAHLGEIVLGRQLGAIHPNSPNRSDVAASFGVYPCAEGTWLTLEVADDSAWGALCRVIGRPELAARFEGLEQRKANRESIDAAITAWLVGHSHKEAMRLLQAAGVPAGAVLDGRQLYADEHLRSRGFFRAMPGLPGVGFKRVPFNLSRMPWAPPRPAPGLGANTREVLATLAGVSEDEYRALAAAGVVGEQPAEGAWTSWY